MPLIFRSNSAPASLKPDDLASDFKADRIFRSNSAPASLKPPGNVNHPLYPVIFRSNSAPASLKLVPGIVLSLSCEIFRSNSAPASLKRSGHNHHGQNREHFPEQFRSGLIEARVHGLRPPCSLRHFPEQFRSGLIEALRFQLDIRGSGQFSGAIPLRPH